MNIFIKTLAFVSVLASCDATTITFNGCTNTNNNPNNSYFTFTSGGGGEYCIATCIPKQNNAEGTVKLIIPALVNGNQVRVLEQAFRWDVYNTDAYSPLNVELVFQSVDATVLGTKVTKYVDFPASLREMFKECNDDDNDTKKKETNKISKTKIDLSGANISNSTTFKYMFYNCLKLSSINLGTPNTSDVTDMSYMFGYCSALPSIDVSEFDTSNVTNFRSMFHGCYDLETLDVSSFNTSKATNMAYMFCKCPALENLDLHTFDTSKVTAVYGMFSGCTAIKTLDVSNFDTSLVTDARWLFQICENLELLRVSSDFVIPNTNGYMFENAKSDMKVIGSGGLEFVETSGNVKSAINDEADRVYAVSGDLGISESLRITLATQLPDARFAEEIDPTALFGATVNDAAYIGTSTSGQTIVVDGSTQTIATNLINKTISGIGYYSANLLLTGTVLLSGNNAEFSENSLIIGDGVKTTTVVFTNPRALSRTDTVVESNGTLSFSGTQNYTLSNNLTVKSGGYLNASKRITIANGATLNFEA